MKKTISDKIARKKNENVEMKKIMKNNLGDSNGLMD